MGCSFGDFSEQKSIGYEFFDRKTALHGYIGGEIFYLTMAWSGCKDSSSSVTPLVSVLT